MRRVVTVATVVVVALLVVGAVRSSPAYSVVQPPPGVAENQWIPITDDLGIVLDDPQKAAVDAKRVDVTAGDRWDLRKGVSARGHLVGRVSGAWIPLDVQASAGILPAR
jgi:hypothetical protein